VPHETTHGDASWASASPVTDGRHLIASFGSAGIFCYDLAGNLQWQVDLGDMRTRNGFGEGSSPAIHGDTVVVNWDHEGPSFIVALDKNSGEVKWRVERDEPTSWSTPVFAEVNGGTQVIVSATNKIRAYDLATGEVLWTCGGMTLNTIPSPIVDGQTVYASSGFRGNALLAIDLGAAKGDITDGKAVRWRFDRDTPYVPSMLLYGERLYFIKHNKGILSCFNTRSGEAVYGPERLDDLKGVYASPVGAGGHVYIVGRAGNTVVLRDGNSFDVVAVNQLDDRFDASPAIVGDTLYLRGHKHLYSIGK
jgi:outer membrane protein assembly factor BamB